MTKKIAIIGGIIAIVLLVLNVFQVNKELETMSKEVYHLNLEINSLKAQSGPTINDVQGCGYSSYFCQEKTFRCEFSFNNGCENVCVDTAGIDCVSNVFNWAANCSPASCVGTPV
jgi:hypothetical protein